MRKHQAEIYVTWREGWPTCEVYVVLDGDEVTLADLRGVPSTASRLRSELSLWLQATDWPPTDD